MKEIILGMAALITILITISLIRASKVPKTINVDTPKYQEDIKSIICDGDCEHCPDCDWCAFSDMRC